MKKSVPFLGGMEVHTARARWFCRDRPPCLSCEGQPRWVGQARRPRTGNGLFGYGEQFDERGSLPPREGFFNSPSQGAFLPFPRRGHRLYPPDKGDRGGAFPVGRDRSRPVGQPRGGVVTTAGGVLFSGPTTNLVFTRHHSAIRGRSEMIPLQDFIPSRTRLSTSRDTRSSAAMSSTPTSRTPSYSARLRLRWALSSTRHCACGKSTVCWRH